MSPPPEVFPVLALISPVSLTCPAVLDLNVVLPVDVILPVTSTSPEDEFTLTLSLLAITGSVWLCALDTLISPDVVNTCILPTLVPSESAVFKAPWTVTLPEVDACNVTPVLDVAVP